MKGPNFFILMLLANFFVTTYLPLGIIYFLNKSEKVKGNIKPNGEKIYYTKDHRLYNSVKEEVLFKNVQEAEKAGFRPPKR